MSAKYDDYDHHIIHTIDCLIYEYGTQRVLETLLKAYKEPKSYRDSKETYNPPSYIQRLIADLNTTLIHYKARYDDDRTRF